MPRTSRMILPALVLFLGFAATARAQEDKGVRELTPEATAKILTDLKIEFNKTAPAKGTNSISSSRAANIASA